MKRNILDFSVLKTPDISVIKSDIAESCPYFVFGYHRFSHRILFNDDTGYLTVFAP